MPKTLGPGTVEAAGRSFSADALPDVFDERDRIYRPRITPLPPTQDVRPDDRHVLTQDGNSCTGHAVAAMVNAVLKKHPGPAGESIHVSPYMLYAMARRYDEFEGEEDLGSSLRGALKGWYHHGLLPTEAWPSLTDGPDLDLDPDLAAEAMSYPLGAFFRVNAFRLDDMQSAVTELYGIAASAAIHEGWLSPVLVEREGQTLVAGSEQTRPRTMAVIERQPDARPLGGHAFAIVGYNEIGFLVQNSWSADWGKGGFATLPYDDWLGSAYDAWVARPGVRSIVTAGRGEKLVADTDGGISIGAGPDLARLRGHVVNLGNDGRLSTSGQFRSTPTQVEAVFGRMEAYHDHWRSQAGEGEPAPRRIVLYAHGGLNSEGTGLGVAEKHLNWWLNNHVFPVSFAWETGAMETLVSQLSDAVKRKLPFGGVRFDMAEQVDRLVEWVARHPLRWIWEQMKQNATLASEEAEVDWSDGPRPEMKTLPGATLTAARVAAYCRAHEDEGVEVHLVGHSAGSIFLSALLPRLDGLGVPVRSVTFLAPAIRADLFDDQALPVLLGQGTRFTSFGLSDERELDDTVGAGGVTPYQKSLLYLVSRGFELPARDSRHKEVPLLGMQRFAADLDPLVDRLDDGELVWAQSKTPPRSRTDAHTHGGLDDDVDTMTSVMLRMGEHEGEPEDAMTYAPHAPLLDPGPPVSPVVDALLRAGWRTGRTE